MHASQGNRQAHLCFVAAQGRLQDALCSLLKAELSVGDALLQAGVRWLKVRQQCIQRDEPGLQAGQLLVKNVLLGLSLVGFSLCCACPRAAQCSKETQDLEEAQVCACSRGI